MSTSKSDVRGPKTSPVDGDPEELPHPVSKPPALGEPHPESRLEVHMFRGPWALSVGPEQINSDILTDRTLFQSEAHRHSGSGLVRNHQAIPRIEAQARIKQYFSRNKPR